MDWNYEPTIKDDYLIDTDRKRLWKIELDLLEWFKSVCDKENLQYFFIGGAAIGVVRHKGFIPWDDDIDIGMLRSDFDKFNECYSEYLTPEISVQFGLMKQSFAYFMRIRNENSTGIIKEQVGMEMSHGVFIEIYPFDFVPKSRLLRSIQWKFSMKLINIINNRYYARSLSSIEQVMNKTLSKKSTLELYSLWYKVCTFFNGLCKQKVDTVSIPAYSSSEVDFYDYCDVAYTQKAVFENTEVQIPCGNHTCLTKAYGDYMKLPPIEERGAHHSHVIYYDVYNSYRKYEDKVDDLKRYFDGEIDRIDL